MKKGTCPKCETKDIHVVPDTGSEMAISLGWGMARLSYYVCINCGYTELYVAEPEKLPQIAAKYRRMHGN